MLFHRELEANLYVCHACGFHMRVDPKRRLARLFDDGIYNRIELPKTILDPLKFRDRKRYVDRLKESHAKAGQGNDAIVVAHGKVGGIATVIAAFDFAFMGGSMGIAVVEGLLPAPRLPVLHEAPLLPTPPPGGP